MLQIIQLSTIIKTFAYVQKHICFCCCPTTSDSAQKHELNHLHTAQNILNEPKWNTWCYIPKLKFGQPRIKHLCARKTSN